MKLVHGLLLLLLPIVVLAGSIYEKKIPEKSVKWIPILGFKHPAAKAFIDVNSSKRQITENGKDFGSAGILIISKQPLSVTFKDKTVLVKSIVRHMVLDCDSGVLAPAIDFYFTIDKPTKSDTPLATIMYADLEGAEVVSKSSLIYHTLCPVHV